MKFFLFLLFCALGAKTASAQTLVVAESFPIKVSNGKQNTYDTNPIPYYQAAQLKFNEPSIFTPQMEEAGTVNASLINFDHPELLEGEVYFTNVRTDLYWERCDDGTLTVIGAEEYTSVTKTLAKLPVIFARVGFTPYGENGKPLKGCYCLPVFVRRADLEKLGLLKN